MPVLKNFMLYIQTISEDHIATSKNSSQSSLLLTLWPVLPYFYIISAGSVWAWYGSQAWVGRSHFNYCSSDDLITDSRQTISP